MVKTMNKYYSINHFNKAEYIYYNSTVQFIFHLPSLFLLSLSTHTYTSQHSVQEVKPSSAPSLKA